MLSSIKDLKEKNSSGTICKESPAKSIVSNDFNSEFASEFGEDMELFLQGCDDGSIMDLKDGSKIEKV